MTTPRTFSLPDDRQAWVKRLNAVRRLNWAGASLLGLGALSLWLSGQWRAAVGGLLLSFLWVFLSERTHRQTQALHQAQAQAEQRAQMAEQAHAAKAEFLASMSHEIRSPLNSLMGMVDLSLSTELSATQRDYLTVAQQSSHLVLKLIDDILDDARLQSGQVRFNYQAVMLQPFAQRILRSHALAAPRSQVKFDLSLQEDLPSSVLLDELRVEQILNNLLTNAVKFTSQGFIRLSVASSAPSQSPQELVFTISDSGPGIAADQRQRIFETYVQADQPADSLHPGTGLGLSISRRLAQGMQGRLELLDQVEPGSSFVLRLPLMRSEALTATDPHPQLVPPSQNVSAAVPRVLLVEDQPMNQQVCRAMLQRLGIQARVARHGAEALAMCQSESFDVVLMDVLMPVMDGLEATRQLRALWAAEGRGYLRILGMTAQVQAQALARCREAGMDACLSKPMSLQQLSDALGLPLQPRFLSTGVAVDDDQELDLARALEYALDPSGLPALIDTFMESLGASRKALGQALHEQDAQEVALQLHAFKGFLPIFAGASLSATIADLERLAKTGNLDAVQSAWEALAPRLDRLAWELTRTQQRYHQG